MSLFSKYTLSYFTEIKNNTIVTFNAKPERKDNKEEEKDIIHLCIIIMKMNTSILTVSFFLFLLILLCNANRDIIYNNDRLVRVHVKTEEQLEEFKSMKLDVWIGPVVGYNGMLIFIINILKVLHQFIH